MERRAEKILILDDEARIREELCEYLTRRKFQVFSAENSSSAFQIMAQNQIDLLFLDFSLSEMDSILILKNITKLFPTTKVIMMSGSINENIRNEVTRNGAAYFMQKPFLHKDVNQALEIILNNKNGGKNV